MAASGDGRTAGGGMNCSGRHTLTASPTPRSMQTPCMSAAMPALVMRAQCLALSSSGERRAGDGASSTALGCRGEPMGVTEQEEEESMLFYLG